MREKIPENFHIMWFVEKTIQYNVFEGINNVLFPLIIGPGLRVAPARK
jgi:hypothetical protein